MRVWKGEIRRTYPHEPQRANGSTHDSGIDVYILPGGGRRSGWKQEG